VRHFVLAADQEVIEAALIGRYGKAGAVRFMDKIVQVTFKLPRIPIESFSPYIEKLAPSAAESLKPHLPVILPAISHNPRQLKRFLNNVRLQDGLLRNSGVAAEFDHLLFWNVLDLVYPDLARDFVDNPAGLELFRGHAQQLLQARTDVLQWEVSKDALEGVPRSFHAYLQDKKLVDLVARFDLPTEQLVNLFTMRQMVVAEEDSLRDRQAKAVRAGLDQMARIPEGLFLYGEDKEEAEIETAFRIDIYPVTNHRFAEFIKADGYQNDEYWTEAGKAWRRKNDIIQPEFWENDKWNQPEQPVVGVSYYEAEAFACWCGGDAVGACGTGCRRTSVPLGR
jgi:hypothetical protein